MSVNSVMISRIQMSYTSEYIANVFWNQNIAQVSSITLIPYFQGNMMYQTAYISIANWCDSEIAYNFIQRLNDKNKKTRIVYYQDNWWSVKKDEYYNYGVNSYNTTSFPERYFKMEEIEDMPIQDEEKEDMPVEELEEGEIQEFAAELDAEDNRHIYDMFMKFLEEIDHEDNNEFDKDDLLFEQMYPNVTLRAHQQTLSI